MAFTQGFEGNLEYEGMHIAPQTGQPTDYFDVSELEYESESSKQKNPENEILQKIQQENTQLKSTVEETRRYALEQARTMGALDGKLNQLTGMLSNQQRQAQSSPPEITDANSAQAFLDHWNNNGGEQPSKQQQDPRAIVRDELNSMAQKQAQEAAAEAQMGNRFRSEYPNIVANHGADASVEWDRLKSLAPHLSVEQRYHQLKKEMVRRYGDGGKVQSSASLPRGAGTDMPPHPEVQEHIGQTRRMTEKQRIMQKDKETARAVYQRRKDQERRTESTPY